MSEAPERLWVKPRPYEPGFSVHRTDWGGCDEYIRADIAQQRIKGLEDECARYRRRVTELKAFIRSFAHNFEAVLREDEDEPG